MIELECPLVGCNHGVAGEKYKMPKLDLYDAMSCTDTYGNLHLVTINVCDSADNTQQPKWYIVLGAIRHIWTFKKTSTRYYKMRKIKN